MDRALHFLSNADTCYTYYITVGYMLLKVSTWVFISFKSNPSLSYFFPFLSNPLLLDLRMRTSSFLGSFDSEYLFPTIPSRQPAGLYIHLYISIFRIIFSVLLVYIHRYACLNSNRHSLIGDDQILKEGHVKMRYTPSF